MDNPERRLSDYIDALNEEKEPEKHRGVADTPEMEKLLATARLVRTLREPVLPGSDYPQRLAKAVAGRIQKNNPNSSRKATGCSRRRWFLPSAVALIASVLLFVLTSQTGLFKTDVVYAMEKAVAQLSNYYGVLEVRQTNAAGEEWKNSRVELWSEGNKYALRQSDGTLTVNNGERKWQVRPQSKELALLPAVPDPTRNDFDLRDEAKRAKQYPHTVVGSEMIAGRQTTKLKISPPGGLAYYLWIDTETSLPIQLQTAMQNALQTTFTFVSFKPNTELDPEIFTYQLPEGYKVVKNDPGQLVAAVEDAAAISGLTPLLPKEAPARIIAYETRIVLDYGDTTIVETAARGAFEPVSNSALGTAAGGPLEVLSEQLRWRQDGIEILVEGERRVELAGQITADLTLPDAGKNPGNKARIKVPVDMEIVKADQQQVDRGSSPWQLDPLQVALTFVNLKVTPEGIQGEPKIPMSSFSLASNNGVEAVVKVAGGPIKQVYLKRPVRQDETGIWSVVGYDPR
ncbi:LolA family protein [Desulfolucanica intricata]|uniref:LolA family protein n=1 Tax=Desulfolucanica intricata TaxID=1285191 RepID=UPI000833B050|nr:sigma-E factor regulatory protein RseB domain-containing protein [Desulfolucanica intricata]